VRKISQVADVCAAPRPHAERVRGAAKERPMPEIGDRYLTQAEAATQRKTDPRLLNRRVEAGDDHADAVRAFLALSRGRPYRPAPARSCNRNLGTPSRGRRATLELPCRHHDPGLWFAEAPAQLDRAKALCAQCPIRLACLAVAVDRAEVAGVWGGHIFDRGRIVAHKRGRGRPRKHPIRATVAPEENVVTRTVPMALHHGPDEVRAAAARLYDAECALHDAHQSRVDAWVQTANRRLHVAVTEYLAVAGPPG
jgi:WhiB family redox-sensing transcriptional regulator